MIIRAVSDDEEDDEGKVYDEINNLNDVSSTNSVFGSSPPAATSSMPSLLSLHSTKLAWILVASALVVLVLVDLAALMSLGPQSDGFAFISWVARAFWTTSMTLTAGGFSATSMNNAVGIGFVASWIYSREVSLHGQTRGKGQRKGATIAQTSPWCWVVMLVCFGHIVSCVYILKALLDSDGDRRKFWLGTKQSQRTHSRV